MPEAARQPHSMSFLRTTAKSRILLVPDQFVFESERRVAKETDEKDFGHKGNGLYVAVQAY